MMQTDQQVDQVDSRTRGARLMCRFRNAPGPLRFALVALPATLAVGALGIPAASAWSEDAGAGVLSTSISVQQVAARTAQGASPRGTQARLRAYSHAGYDYDDAVVLARLWSNATSAYGAKLRAGAMLVNHEAVPISPNQNPFRVSNATALDAFFNNGYTYRDAVRLARIWKRPRDVGGAKAMAGRLVLAGRPLPGVSASQAESAKLRAYFDADFDYDDAVMLSRLWSFETTPRGAKLRAGAKLLAGEDVPIPHGEDAWGVSEETALDAYFNNGYDYRDAQRLAKAWHESDLRDTKVTAGRKILAGLALPLR